MASLPYCGPFVFKKQSFVLDQPTDFCFFNLSICMSTSKDESMDRLVRTYLSSGESGLTMSDSHSSLTDRRISDLPRRISDSPPSSDIADALGSQIVSDPTRRVEFNPYNSPV